MGCCQLIPQSVNKIEIKINDDFADLSLRSDENKETIPRDNTTQRCSFTSDLDEIDSCFLVPNSPNLKRSIASTLHQSLISQHYSPQKFDQLETIFN